MSGYVKEIERALKDAFVAPFHWYSVNGRRLYPVYGGSGGLSNSLTALLIAKAPTENGTDMGHPYSNVVEACGGRWFNVRFEQSDTYVSAMEKIRTAVTALEAKQEGK